MSLRLTSIQRFSTYDGPGIRTTLFTKGCSIRCPWCSNPENLIYDIQDYRTESGIKKTYGRDYSVEEVFEICMRDKEFYGDNGGVTASGGEALLQALGLSELFTLLNDADISCGIETSLYAPTTNLKLLLPKLDFLYVDMKILNKEDAKKHLSGDLEIYNNNLDYLFGNYSKEKIIVRIPIVKGYTDNKENMSECRKILEKYKPFRCEIFSVHNLGAAKYKSLGAEYKQFETIDNDTLEKYKDYLAVNGVDLFINKL